MPPQGGLRGKLQSNAMLGGDRASDRRLLFGLRAALTYRCAQYFSANPPPLFAFPAPEGRTCMLRGCRARKSTDRRQLRHILARVCSLSSAMRA